MIFISENSAVKEDSSGEQAYMPKLILSSAVCASGLPQEDSANIQMLVIVSSLIGFIVFFVYIVSYVNPDLAIQIYTIASELQNENPSDAGPKGGVGHCRRNSEGVSPVIFLNRRLK